MGLRCSEQSEGWQTYHNKISCIISIGFEFRLPPIGMPASIESSIKRVVVCGTCPDKIKMVQSGFMFKRWQRQIQKKCHCHIFFHFSLYFFTFFFRGWHVSPHLDDVTALLLKTVCSSLRCCPCVSLQSLGSTDSHFKKYNLDLAKWRKSSDCQLYFEHFLL